MDAAKANHHSCPKVTTCHLTVAREPTTYAMSAITEMIVVGAGNPFKSRMAESNYRQQLRLHGSPSHQKYIRRGGGTNDMTNTGSIPHQVTIFNLTSATASPTATRTSVLLLVPQRRRHCPPQMKVNLHQKSFMGFDLVRPSKITEPRIKRAGLTHCTQLRRPSKQTARPKGFSTRELPAFQIWWLIASQF